MPVNLTSLILSLLLVVSLVAVGGTAGPDDGPRVAPDARQQAAPGDGTATVTVSGTGEASAEPNRALVFVAVTATGDSASAAADGVAANASWLRSALASSRLVDEVTTTDYRIFERRNDDGTRTFVARQSFEVTVPDPDDAGAVVDLAVDSGATEVNGVAFTLSRSRYESLRERALERAVEDARDQAEVLAASTDLALENVRRVVRDDPSFVPRQELAATSGTVVDPGPVTVTASVTVTYNATQASAGANATGSPAVIRAG
ncbi:SIMPL domain-containing protein [Haloarchaeobius sp. HRN-SO-5]|uniref:SIMPL domain-containing protein n=1 Tax=Haloarchaeobius sp. HRN-SO-5 TaxID=3446118 RepID=UPI003EBD94C5